MTLYWRCVLWLLEVLPLPVANVLSRCFLRLFSVMAPKWRRMTFRNLAAAQVGDPNRIAPLLLRSLARMVVLFTRFRSFNKQNIWQWIHVEGVEHFYEAKRRGRGVIAASGHLGNWELGPLTAALGGEPVLLVTRRFTHPALERYIAARRTLHGNRVVEAREAAWPVAFALRRGETVCTVIDAHTEIGPCAHVDFFGRPARVSTALARLAASTGAAVVPAFVFWSEREHRYTMRFYPAMEIGGMAEEDTRRLYALLESVIREYPDQWLWIIEQGWKLPVPPLRFRFPRLAARMAWRGMRSFPSRFLTSVAILAIAVAFMICTRTLNQQLRSRVANDARQWIAADVAVNLKEVPSEEENALTGELSGQGIEQTLVTEALGMISSNGAPDSVLSSVKAIDPSRYPFYGSVELQPALPLRNALSDDTALVTGELLTRLHARIGEAMRIQDAEFRIAAVITAEPDRYAGSPNTLPRAILTRNGMERTGLLSRPGNISHRLLFRAPPHRDLTPLRARLEEVFPYGEVVDYHEPDPKALFVLDAVFTFLNLIAWMALVTGAAGVGMTMYLNIEQSMDTIATMKALGARSAQVLWIYLLEAGTLACAGAAIGVVASVVFGRLLAATARHWLPFSLTAQWDWQLAAEAFLLALVAAMAASAGPLLLVRLIPPLVLLRRHVSDLRTKPRTLPAILSATLMVAAFAGLAAWLVKSPHIGLVFVSGLAGGVVLLIAVSRSLLLLFPCILRAWKQGMPASLRHGALGVGRPGNYSGVVVAALALGVMMVSATYFGQSALASAVLDAVPTSGANLFLIGVEPKEIGSLRQWMERQAGVRGPIHTAPFVYVRLARVDEMPIEEARRSGRYPNAVFFRMWFATCSDAVPDGPPLQVVLSKNFGVDPGATLEFAAKGKTLHARVSSLRALNAVESIGFGIAFPCSAFEGMAVFHHAAVAVDPPQEEALRRAIAVRYPAVTVLGRSELTGMIEDTLGRVIAVLRVLSFVVLDGGAVILALMVAATRQHRLREMAVFKSLGARRGQLILQTLAEFGLLGLMAGAMGSVLGAAFASLLVSGVLRKQVLILNGNALLGTTFAAVLLAMGSGWLATRRILAKRPLAVLRDE